MANPYGTWPSSVTPESIVAGVRQLDDVGVRGDTVWWTHGDPADGGRVSLWRRDGDAAPREVTPDHYVRTSVHEYGGGAWAVGGSRDEPVVVFSSWPDHRLWVVTGDAEPRPITAEDSAHRYADLRVHPDRDLVIAVREDHRNTDAEPVNTVVALRLSGDNVDGGTVLRSGPDFCASPELSDAGLLAWVEWDHPAMPWDRTRLCVARLDDDATALEEIRVVVDRVDTSAVFPRWVDDTTLVHAVDSSGWWQLSAVQLTSGTGDLQPAGSRVLWSGEHDVCGPMWQLGMKPYAITDRGVLAAWFVDGRQRLGLVGLDGLGGEEPTVLRESLDAVSAITVDGSAVAMIVGHADAPSEVVRWDLTAPQDWHTVTTSSESEPDPAWTSVPESVWWDSDLGPVQGWYYPPTNPDVTVPTDERPPMIIKSHGGPTSMSRPLYAAAVQYWTSRGYALLDVNYGGSSGFGRAYRQRLAGRWGIVDVADCIGGAVALAERGLADRDRLVITGGSAGGFTTLAALTSSEAFAAGVSLYGVADLSALARDTHKFESRYLDGLVGPWPDAEQVYHERSPINQIDRLDSPMLLLQGLDDRVVPPNQAEMIADAVRAKGLPVSLIMYEGEGHGFRKAETVINYYQSMEAFCARVLGFQPAHSLPALTIENLDG